MVEESKPSLCPVNLRPIEPRVNISRSDPYLPFSPEERLKISEKEYFRQIAQDARGYPPAERTQIGRQFFLDRNKFEDPKSVEIISKIWSLSDKSLDDLLDL